MDETCDNIRGVAMMIRIIEVGTQCCFDRGIVQDDMENMTKDVVGKESLGLTIGSVEEILLLENIILI